MKKDDLYKGKTVLHRKSEKGVVERKEVVVTWTAVAGPWVQVKSLNGGPQYWVHCSKLETK